MVRALLHSILIGFLLSAPSAYAEFKLGIVFDKGGKDDKSFNASAYRGAMEAKEKLKVSVKFVEASDDSAFEPMLKAFAKKDFDLIVGIGVSQGEAIKKVAAEFPTKKFAIVDAEVNAPNVQSLMFAEHEGSYLVGAIAAMASKTGKIGFIGGMDIPLIRRFQMGYEAGAKKINPNIQVVSNFVGVTGDAWNNPPKAKELALGQYAGGVDVIFQAAGASGAGLFDAAEQKKKLAIGVDSNQNWIKPGLVLTSMLKNVDRAVYAAVEQTQSGKFQPGVKVFNLASGGIDFAIDEYNRNILTKDMEQKAVKLREDIIAGKIDVPDFYQLRNKPAAPTKPTTTKTSKK